MSGGVDSSVAAALLKKQGYFVIGVFMKLSGLNKEAEMRARRVAKILKIPFFVLDARKEFKKKVVDNFLREYKQGNTPNPCVVCNKEIKFGFLIKKALSLGADFVATGHYVRLRPGDPNLRMTSECSEYSDNSDADSDYSDRILLKAKDKEKDQSYFLWQLNQKQLKHILFPIGEYTKPEVRKLAKKFKLPTAGTPESQEVCFVRGLTADFLKKYLKTKPGNIVDKNLPAQASNKILGKHQGLWFYTIGQRKGIGLSGGPYYVIAKDFKNNNLIVSKNKKDLLQKELIAKNINWISGKKPKLPIKARVKIRYRTNLANATLNRSYTTILERSKIRVYRVVFDRPQRAVTPGQSVVFYLGRKLLGGGIII